MKAREDANLSLITSLKKKEIKTGRLRVLSLLFLLIILYTDSAVHSRSMLCTIPNIGG